MRFILRILLGVVVAIGLLVVIMHVRADSQREEETAYHAALKKNVTLSSKSFPPNGDMPTNCSCRGAEASPALTWESDQAATKSYAILATDYDVPTPAYSVFNFPHWVVYNLPASVHSLPEGVTIEQMRLLNGKFGKNGAGDLKYIGPCPPIGRHAYLFRVYALDQMLSFGDAVDKEGVLDTMKGHILGYGELTGYFQ